MLIDRNDEMHHEHQDLVDALMTGSAERAEQVAADQIRAAQQMVIDGLFSSPSLQSLTLALM